MSLLICNGFSSGEEDVETKSYIESTKVICYILFFLIFILFQLVRLSHLCNVGALLLSKSFYSL